MTAQADVKSSPSYTVWIAGASGFCGQALVQKLSASPHLVLPHIRPTSSQHTTLSNQWKALGINPISIAWSELSDALMEHQPQVIVSLVGTTQKKAKRGGGSYQEVDYGLNHKLIQLAQTLPTPPLMIYLSAMGIEWAKWSAYLKVRLDVESELMASQLPYISIRPGLITGPSRVETRLKETASLWLSNTILALSDRVGFKTWGDGFRPLDAPEVAQIIEACIQQWDGDQRTQETYELKDLHALLHHR